jgi:phenylacetate-CoA ligase
MFAPTLRLLKESQYWDKGQLLEFQVAKLRAILKHSALHIPFYRRLFRQIGFDPDRVKHPADLRMLPLLDKGTLRDNAHDFLAENIPSRARMYVTTGGTSGTPLGLYNLRHSGGRERAFMYSQWARVGFSHGDVRAMIMGWPIKKKRHWKYEVSERAFVFSNYHMTRSNVAKYVDVMRRQRVLYLHAYPSAVFDFVRHLKDLQIDPPAFRAVLSSSETLYPGQRELIESFFGCRVFSWYGHTEDVILAGECETSNCYHVSPEYGVAEVIKEDGTQAEHEGETGELVGTSLDNFAMPLIRYRTDDWATIGPSSCDCGRNYPLLKETQGRRQDLLVGRLDNLISLTALNMHTDVFDRVRQMQFRQREKGQVELVIERLPEYSERDDRRILAALNEKVGDTIQISLTFAEHIPLSPRGKCRLVIQELDIPRISYEEARLDSSA